MIKRKALVVVDVQNALFESPVGLHNEETFFANVGQLIGKARAADIPVVFTQHCGPDEGAFERDTWGWQIHPGLGRRNHEPAVAKLGEDAFQDSSLDGVLRDLGANDLYFCGFATPARFDATVRTAHERGYSVTIVVDAQTTVATAALPTTSAASLAAPARVGSVETTESVNFGGPEGSERSEARVWSS